MYIEIYIYTLMLQSFVFHKPCVYILHSSDKVSMIIGQNIGNEAPDVETGCARHDGKLISP